MFRHGFNLLFGKFKAAFAFFRNIFPCSDNLIHRLSDGRELPV